MRPIKFRAWDNRRKKMLYEKEFTDVDEDGDDKDYVYKFIQLGDRATQIICRIDGNFVDSVDDFNSELMQFTGLLDKNGKEIYEGDIVKVFADGILLPDMPLEFVRRGSAKIPEWFECVVEYIKIDNGMYLNICNFNNFKPLIYEVIGNKFMNPELLK